MGIKGKEVHQTRWKSIHRSKTYTAAKSSLNNLARILKETQNDHKQFRKKN